MTISLYFQQVFQIFQESQTIARKQSPTAALRHLRSYVLRTDETCFFEGSPGPPPELPEGFELHEIHQENAPEFVPLLLDIVAPSDLLLFERQATCYLLCKAKQPIALGWKFAQSSLLEQLRFPKPCTFLGGFWVSPSHRGQGLYPFLLRWISALFSDPEHHIIVTTTAENTASQRGLSKARFIFQGQVKLLIVGGRIARYEWLSHKHPMP